MRSYTLFRPSRAETKAKTTTEMAKSIIAQETSARHAKTKRLRAARLERAAAETQAQAEAPKPARRLRNSGRDGS